MPEWAGFCAGRRDAGKRCCRCRQTLVGEENGERESPLRRRAIGLPAGSLSTFTARMSEAGCVKQRVALVAADQADRGYRESLSTQNVQQHGAPWKSLRERG